VGFFIYIYTKFYNYEKIHIISITIIAGLAQTETGQEQEMPYNILIPVSVLQTPSTTTWIGTFGSTGVPGKVAPENISIPQIPTSYVPTSATIGGHLAGINTAIANIPITTAGNITRVWFTADQTTITAGTFNLTSAAGKGATAGDTPTQTVTNNDDEKRYFARDLIGNAFVTATLFPPGAYSGNLSVSTTPNSASQRFTVELYKCDTNGTPIASGIAGAPVGDLGVTVILILDSGIINLSDSSITNIKVDGSLAAQLSVGIGERIRYHVSAEKVGTASASITESVYYGNSYNSYLDVPTPLTSSGVANASTVTGVNVTNALDNLNVDKLEGSGTANYIPKWTASNTQSNSLIYDDGTNIGISTTAPSIYSHSGTGKVLELLNTGTSTNSQSHLNLSTSATVANSSIGTLSWVMPSVSNSSKIGGFIGVYTDATHTSASPATNMSFFNRNGAGGGVVEGMSLSYGGKLTVTGTVSAPLTVRKISTNTTLANSDNGTIILLTASCTVTLPNGLMSGFNCSFATQTGVTMTYALGGSVTLVNNESTTMPERSEHTIVNTDTANEYLTGGL